MTRSTHRSWADLIPHENPARGPDHVALQSLITVTGYRELTAQMSLALARKILEQAEQSVHKARERWTEGSRRVADFRQDAFVTKLSGLADIRDVRLVLADESRLVKSAEQTKQQLEQCKVQASLADRELQDKMRLLRILSIRREKYIDAADSIEKN